MFAPDDRGCRESRRLARECASGRAAVTPVSDRADGGGEGGENPETPRTYPSNHRRPHRGRALVCSDWGPARRGAVSARVWALAAAAPAPQDYRHAVAGRANLAAACRARAAREQRPVEAVRSFSPMGCAPCYARIARRDAPPPRIRVHLRAELLLHARRCEPCRSREEAYATTWRTKREYRRAKEGRSAQEDRNAQGRRVAQGERSPQGSIAKVGWLTKNLGRTEECQRGAEEHQQRPQAHSLASGCGRHA